MDSIADEFDVVEPDHARSPRLRQNNADETFTIRIADGFPLPLSQPASNAGGIDKPCWPADQTQPPKRLGDF